MAIHHIHHNIAHNTVFLCPLNTIQIPYLGETIETFIDYGLDSPGNLGKSTRYRVNPPGASPGELSGELGQANLVEDNRDRK